MIKKGDNFRYPSLADDEKEILLRAIGNRNTSLFDQVLTQIVTDRKEKTYTWKVDRKVLFDLVCLFYTTDNLQKEGRFFQTFVNLQAYLNRLQSYLGTSLFSNEEAGYLALQVTTLLTGKKALNNLDYLNFDGIFITGVVNQTQIDQMLQEVGLVTDQDQFFPLTLPNWSWLGKESDLDSISSPDRVVTERRYQTVQKNLRYLDEVRQDPTRLPILAEQLRNLFQISDNPIDITIPNSSSLRTLHRQKQGLLASLSSLTDPVREAELRKKVNEVTRVSNQLTEMGVTEETGSLLQKFLEIFHSLSIPVTVQMLPLDEVTLISPIDPLKVAASYTAQVTNRATTTGQKILFTIRSEKYQVFGDPSVIIGKYLADTETDIQTGESRMKSSFSFLAIQIEQEDLTVEAIRQKIGQTPTLQNSDVLSLIESIFDETVLTFKNQIGTTNSYINTLIDNLSSIVKKNLLSSETEPLSLDLTFWDLNLEDLDTKIFETLRGWVSEKVNTLKGVISSIKDFFVTSFSIFYYITKIVYLILDVLFSEYIVYKLTFGILFTVFGWVFTILKFIFFDTPAYIINWINDSTKKVLGLKQSEPVKSQTIEDIGKKQSVIPLDNVVKENKVIKKPPKSELKLEKKITDDSTISIYINRDTVNFLNGVLNNFENIFNQKSLKPFTFFITNAFKQKISSEKNVNIDSIKIQIFDTKGDKIDIDFLTYKLIVDSEGKAFKNLTFSEIVEKIKKILPIRKESNTIKRSGEKYEISLFLDKPIVTILKKDIDRYVHLFNGNDLESFNTLILAINKETKTYPYKIKFKNSEESKDTYYLTSQVVEIDLLMYVHLLSENFEVIRYNLVRRGFQPVDITLTEIIEEGNVFNLVLKINQENISKDYLYGISLNKTYYNMFSNNIFINLYLTKLLISYKKDINSLYSMPYLEIVKALSTVINDEKNAVNFEKDKIVLPFKFSKVTVTVLIPEDKKSTIQNLDLSDQSLDAIQEIARLFPNEEKNKLSVKISNTNQQSLVIDLSTYETKFNKNREEMIELLDNGDISDLKIWLNRKIHKEISYIPFKEGIIKKSNIITFNITNGNDCVISLSLNQNIIQILKSKETKFDNLIDNKNLLDMVKWLNKLFFIDKQNIPYKKLFVEFKNTKPPEKSLKMGLLRYQVLMQTHKKIIDNYFAKSKIDKLRQWYKQLIKTEKSIYIDQKYPKIKDDKIELYIDEKTFKIIESAIESNSLIAVIELINKLTIIDEKDIPYFTFEIVYKGEVDKIEPLLEYFKNYLEAKIF